jgi:hypothetical protein
LLDLYIYIYWFRQLCYPFLSQKSIVLISSFSLVRMVARYVFNISVFGLCMLYEWFLIVPTISLLFKNIYCGDKNFDYKISKCLVLFLFSSIFIDRGSFILSLFFSHSQRTWTRSTWSVWRPPRVCGGSQDSRSSSITAYGCCLLFIVAFQSSFTSFILGFIVLPFLFCSFSLHSQLFARIHF